MIDLLFVKVWIVTELSSLVDLVLLTLILDYAHIILVTWTTSKFVVFFIYLFYIYLFIFKFLSTNYAVFIGSNFVLI